MADQSLEQTALATVGTDVAAVEQTPAGSLDQQRIGIIGRVIDEIGRDAERTDLESPAIVQLE